jgi:hypothetical protein
MKTTKLVVLTAVVLFGLTLSSCKNCNENKSKGKDNGEDNPVIDRDKDKDKSKDSLDNPAIDEGESVPAQAKAIESEVELEVRGRLVDVAERVAVQAARDGSVAKEVREAASEGVRMGMWEDVWEDVWDGEWEVAAVEAMSEVVREVVMEKVMEAGEPRLAEWVRRVKDKRKAGLDEVSGKVLETTAEELGLGWVDVDVVGKRAVREKVRNAVRDVRDIEGRKAERARSAMWADLQARGFQSYVAETADLQTRGFQSFVEAVRAQSKERRRRVIEWEREAATEEVRGTMKRKVREAVREATTVRLGAKFSD